MPIRVGQYEALLDRNEVFLSRTKGVGIVSRERLLELGVTGPLLRAAGEPWDLRKAFDYLAYPEMDFKIPVGTVGDNYDRYRVRVAEMVESTRIIEQALDGAARGPVHRRRPQVRAAAALGALDLDGVADPPLQARHRGLPGRPRARSTTRSRARAGSSAASSSPTAPRSRPASTSATPPSSTCRRFRTWRSDGYIADMICQPRHARPDPRRGRPVSPRRRSAGVVATRDLPVDRARHRGARPPSRSPGGDPRAARSRLPGRSCGSGSRR